jgi:hypothetical protein
MHHIRDRRRCEDRLETYYHDQGGFNPEFLVDSLRFGEVIPQLLVVLVQPASFENTTREVL